MTQHLSEEAAFVAAHWDTIQELHAAEDKLRAEVKALLDGLRHDLAHQDWWKAKPGWKFAEFGEDTVYVSHTHWWDGAGALLWIAISEFDPEHLFGSGSPPELYIWVDTKAPDLLMSLRAMVEAADNLPGPPPKGKGGYIVRRRTKKLIPEAFEASWADVRADILDFIGSYAQMASTLLPDAGDRRDS